MTINSNANYLFFIKHNQNWDYNHNLCYIQELICPNKPSNVKFKRVCKDFPNVFILTKRAMPGEVQVTFGHVIVGNKLLR